MTAHCTQAPERAGEDDHGRFVVVLHDVTPNRGTVSAVYDTGTTREAQHACRARLGRGWFPVMPGERIPERGERVWRRDWEFGVLAS